MFYGIDCFGPFVTKRGRKECNRYGLIFTRMSSRAVHLEILDDMSTDAFIYALRCFISLRGLVCQLRYDKSTNFVGAKNEFKEALKQCDTEALKAFLVDKQCEFTFNAPAASHAGSVWERKIRTIRNVLNVTIAQCSGRLDDASLRTLLYGAMAKSGMYRWRNLKVNYMVIIKEDTLPRNQWQLGRVVDIAEGTDGLVRRVKVQVGERKLTKKQNHCSKPSIIERPIQKLVLLLEDE